MTSHRYDYIDSLPSRSLALGLLEGDACCVNSSMSLLDKVRLLERLSCDPVAYLVLNLDEGGKVERRIVETLSSVAVFDRPLLCGELDLNVDMEDEEVVLRQYVRAAMREMRRKKAFFLSATVWKSLAFSSVSWINVHVAIEHAGERSIVWSRSVPVLMIPAFKSLAQGQDVDALLKQAKPSGSLITRATLHILGVKRLQAESGVVSKVTALQYPSPSASLPHAVLLPDLRQPME